MAMEKRRPGAGRGGRRSGHGDGAHDAGDVRPALDGTPRTWRWRLRPLGYGPDGTQAPAPTHAPAAVPSRAACAHLDPGRFALVARTAAGNSSCSAVASRARPTCRPRRSSVRGAAGPRSQKRNRRNARTAARQNLIDATTCTGCGEKLDGRPASRARVRDPPPRGLSRASRRTGYMWSRQ